MKLLIDIGHPAHVHLFKHFSWEMQKKGHSILFSARNKEHEIYLLEIYGFNYVSFGQHYKSKIGKIFGLLKFNAKMLRQSIKFKPDLFLSHGSMYAAQVSWLLNKPHISLEDTGNIEQVRLYLPFTEYVLTSNVFPFEYGNKHIRYNSHHELAYLSPRFYIPNQDFKRKYHINSTEKFAILRFVSWKATHDKGQSGMAEITKVKLIKKLSENYTVFISSEEKLPKKFRKYELIFSPEDIHNALYYADLFIGEGTTMAMEAAILGTPSLYINSLQYANVKDMEQYGLLYCFQNENKLVEKINTIISTPNLKKETQTRRDKMLTEKIDLTSLLIWLVENYPESAKTMRINPDFQFNFRAQTRCSDDAHN